MEATTDIQSEREKDSLRDKILTNIDNPEQLEKLYRLNKQNFSKEIAGMPADNPSDLIRFWKIRLDIENENKRAFSSKTDISIVVLLAVFTGLL
jgi:hypothetical protein